MGKHTRNYLIYISTLFLVSVLTVVFLVQETEVAGSSMEPAYRDGDSVLVNKAAYGNDEPERFDVVIFSCEFEDSDYCMKRIIGLPGETVEIRDGSIYIDGALLPEPYGNAPMKEAGLADEPVHLGENEYFVLGDNRNYSTDSRFQEIGRISGDAIFGKVVRTLRHTDGEDRGDAV